MNETGTPPPPASTGSEKTVSLNEILAESGLSRQDFGSTYLQRAGVKLFRWVLWSTMAALAALFLYLLWQLWKTPALENLQSGTAIDTTLLRVAVEQREAVFDNFLEGVRTVIVNVFLPLLTAILGYIFGTSDAGASSSNSDAIEEV
jgi:hypothetical protein